MNKKTKTMFVMQPGGFGSGAVLFSVYEFENNLESETSPAPVLTAQPAVARQTQYNRSWTQSATRLSEVFRRSVWQPLTRRMFNFGNAA